MKIKVDQEKCIGCGLCANMCPEAFRLNNKGKSEGISKDNKHKECAKKAEASCPVVAIKID